MVFSAWEFRSWLLFPPPLQGRGRRCILWCRRRRRRCQLPGMASRAKLVSFEDEAEELFFATTADRVEQSVAEEFAISFFLFFRKEVTAPSEPIKMAQFFFVPSVCGRRLGKRLRDRGGEGGPPAVPFFSHECWRWGGGGNKVISPPAASVFPHKLLLFAPFGTAFLPRGSWRRRPREGGRAVVSVSHSPLLLSGLLPPPLSLLRPWDREREARALFLPPPSLMPLVGRSVFPDRVIPEEKK